MLLAEDDIEKLGLEMSLMVRRCFCEIVFRIQPMDSALDPGRRPFISGTRWHNRGLPEAIVMTKAHASDLKRGQS